jgi:hypothetical protein
MTVAIVEQARKLDVLFRSRGVIARMPAANSSYREEAAMNGAQHAQSLD